MSPRVSRPSTGDFMGIAVPGASPETAVSVTDLARACKDALETQFPPLWVAGEITDFKHHRNGHWYFCLRDAASSIRCVVWSRDQQWIPASPDDGMQVMALGQLTVYAARGDLQMTVRRIEAAGDGLRRKAVEVTLEKLRKDGLLAPERKRRLPRIPLCIGIVTSADGAALHDIRSVCARRWPGISLVLSPSRVQGEGAAADLCVALGRLRRWGGADVVIIGRGGGGRDDLWAFNDDALARAIADFPVPVVTAVGHETDTSLCDLVADLRAATPSAAAEASVPDRGEMAATLSSLRQSLEGAMDMGLRRRAESLRAVADTMTDSATYGIERRRELLARGSARLDALSPLSILTRGYSLARGTDGRTLSSVEQFNVGEAFRLMLRDGSIEAATRVIHPTLGSERA